MCLSVSSSERELQVLLAAAWVRPFPLHTQLFHKDPILGSACYFCLLLKLQLVPLLSLSGLWRTKCCMRGEHNVQKLHDCRWETLHCLDNKYILSLLIDTLLTSLAYSFMKPAGFQTIERDFLRKVSPGSKELFTQERKTEQTHVLHGSVRFVSSSVFVACRSNYQ